MDNSALALAITKALAYTENGGAPSAKNEKAGKSGEMKSIFQFEPGTWKAYSKQITGQDDLPLTPQNEALVAHGKVNAWLKQGYNTMQIASLWNSGHPDGYKDNIGTNKEGVAFDTPAYAKKVQNYTDEFITQAEKSKLADADPNIQKLTAIADQAKQNSQSEKSQQPIPQKNPALAQVNGGANFGTQQNAPVQPNTGLMGGLIRGMS